MCEFFFADHFLFHFFVILQIENNDNSLVSLKIFNI